jgi:hypothetical protein
MPEKLRDKLREILQQSQVDTENMESSIKSCPPEIFFLTRKFITESFPIAGLPIARVEEMLDFAGFIASDDILRHFAWFLHQCYIGGAATDYISHWEISDVFGEDVGKLNILLGLSLLPSIETRLKRQNIPRKYAEAAISRLGAGVDFYALAESGKLGLSAASLQFMLNYKERPMFRIGRFDFLLTRITDPAPFVYRIGDKIMVFCGNGWHISATGERVAAENPTEIISCLKTTTESVSGLAVNPVTGLAENKITEFPLTSCKLIAGEGMWGVFFHIPAGGGMTPAVCDASFREALGFFEKYYPDKPVKLIYSSSWVFNPAWLEYLPKSNISALISRGYIFPVISGEREGLRFVFGRDDGYIEDYKAESSLQRALLACWRECGTLKRSGFFILPDEISEINKN